MALPLTKVADIQLQLTAYYSSIDPWVQILLGAKAAYQPWASCSHLCASVTKQYNLVPAKGRRCSAVGKVTAGLAESSGKIPPGGWLIVTCGMIACTPGSAPSPTLGNEYEKPLSFLLEIRRSRLKYKFSDRVYLHTAYIPVACWNNVSPYRRKSP